MTINSSIALLSAMILLAAIPGPSLLCVLARGVGNGWRNGVWTILGVLCGDYVFIVVSILGLTAAAQTLGSAFIWVKYIGAVYLIYLGVGILMSSRSGSIVYKKNANSYFSDYLSGLIVTLSNPKAILFYVSFFPAFIDLESVRFIDSLLVLGIATFGLGGTMLAYLAISIRTKSAIKTESQSQTGNAARTIAGGTLISSGLWVAVK